MGMGDTPASLPRELGYKMPAEWESHEGTWIGWPYNASDWPGKFAAIPWVYAEIVRLLSQRENVHILVHGEAQEQRAASILKRAGANLGQVSFHRWPTDRVWLRDSGPIFVKNPSGELAITDWKFNAWAKYDDWRLDDQVPGHVSELLDMQRWQPKVTLADGTKHRLVLEGGSIDVNGAGTLITTEECLLSEVQQRNPGVSREQLEAAFRDYLGIEQVLWMDRGVAGDDTHGHVDDITRFVGPSTIVTAVEPNTADENHAPLAENLARLKASRTPDGKQWTIVELPLPRPVVFRGQRLPASYANFYIANGLVLVPTFHDPNDRVALGILAELFPDREVIGIHSVDLVWGLGTLHCMTQQQPAGF
ncbi:agmatine deiminase family protein [Acidicapsa acidisoli]|uniref:agmatine deiminase family protein n=1 Tax=Acidicapsa acidisoli TaxID=1615681 RepID=UPI0021E07FFC|nr:agmatine deiminase family protein [Acidicapsa acidisoli]